MQDSIFTKIIKGELPAYRVYEDEKTLAFLDIHPVQPGHVLVIPKVQIDHLWDLPEEEYAALMTTCKKVANRQREVLKTARVGVKVEGVDVPHAHVHLIPFNYPHEFRLSPDLSADPHDEALSAMAEKLAF